MNPVRAKSMILREHKKLDTSSGCEAQSSCLVKTSFPRGACVWPQVLDFGISPPVSEGWQHPRASSAPRRCAAPGAPARSGPTDHWAAWWAPLLETGNHQGGSSASSPSWQPSWLQWSCGLCWSARRNPRVVLVTQNSKAKRGKKNLWNCVELIKFFDFC